MEANWKAFCSALKGIQCFARHRFEKVIQTTSTNDDLKSDWKFLPPPPRLLVAEHQTGGRGQFDRTWYDSPGKSLLFSFSWKCSDEELISIPHSLVMGVAVHRALTESMEKDHKIWLKWPNDIFIEEKKICGILMESVNKGSDFFLVIGVGINVLEAPGEKNLNAGTLDTGAPMEKTLERILKQWEMCLNMSSEELLNEFRRRSYPFWRGQCSLDLPGGQSVRVTPDDVDRCGRLICTDLEGNRRRVSSANQIHFFPAEQKQKEKGG